MCDCQHCHSWCPEPRLGPTEASTEAILEAGKPAIEAIIARAKELQQKGTTVHYRNGREAKNGDKIVQLGGSSGADITHFGVLHSATPGNDYCNGQIAPVQPSAGPGACMCDCLHIDDVAAMLKEKGLDKRPVGK